MVTKHYGGSPQQINRGESLSQSIRMLPNTSLHNSSSTNFFKKHSKE